jgi:hypothetical protein
MARLLRASEIGQYVYCQRAWWLARIQGVAEGNGEAREKGIEQHVQYGRALSTANRLLTLGVILLVAGLIVTLLAAIGDMLHL